MLVDRLWPRGLTKKNADLDLWLRDIAPSPRLRTWFGHDPERWQAFQRRYWTELKHQPELVADLRKKGRKGAVTLVYAARDEDHNHALARSYSGGNDCHALPGERGQAADVDFLARVDLLAAVKKMVLASDLSAFYALGGYLHSYSSFDVRQRIRSGDSSWRQLVAPEVAAHRDAHGISGFACEMEATR